MPAVAPRMPPIQPHIRSRLLLTPSPGPTGVSMSGGTLRLSRRVHRIQRVADETLCTPERARHIEATIEAAQVLRGLEGLLERGLRETQRGRKSLELPRVDLGH